MDKQRAFADYLHSRGLAFTSERQAILEQILAGGRHFQADELYLRLLGNKTLPVSRATVYRTLNLLVDSGLVRKVAFVDRHSHYEHLFGHHHLTCRNCGRIVEFNDPDISRALEKICRKNRFQSISRKVEVIGLCAKCRRSSDK